MSKTISMRSIALPAVLAASLALGACGTTGTRVGTGAAIGAAGGAIGGAIVGSPLTGAAVGAGVGALGGYVYDQAKKDKI